MTETRFGTRTPIPYALPEKVDIMIQAYGSVEAETDEKGLESIIAAETELSLRRHITENSGKTKYLELVKLRKSFGEQISAELTEKFGCRFTVEVESIDADRDSLQKMISLGLFGDVLMYTNMTDDHPYKPDCVPPWGTGMGNMMIRSGTPGILAKDIKTDETEIMPQVTRPDIVSSGAPAPHCQPKFCPECGNRLPEFRVNFCPECGSRIQQ